MKKLFLLLFFILLAGVIAAAVFVITFDADSYRPLVASQIEKIVGNPVKIDRISLGWHGGMALDVKNLAIYPDQESKSEPAIELQSASALVQLMPLLKRQIDVTSVILKQPRLQIIQDEKGVIRIAGVRQQPVQEETAPGKPASETVKSSGETDIAAMIPVLINMIKIEDGEIRFTVRDPKNPMDIRVRSIDVVLQNVSLFQEIGFESALSVFSRNQNIRIKGKFMIPTQSKPAQIDDLRAEVDLTDLDQNALKEAVPALKDLELSGDTAGNLVGEIDHLELDERGLQNLTAHVRMTGGRMGLKDLKSPLEDVTLDLTATADQAKLKLLEAKFAGGTIHADGIISDLKTLPRANFQIISENLNLDQMIPAAKPGEPSLSGVAALSFRGTAQGKEEPQIMQTLSGQGTVKLRDGVLVDMNILREVFNQMSIIPGLVASLQRRLPEEYQSKFEEKNTVLHPVDLPFVISNGILTADRLQIATDTFQIFGSARAGLADQSLQAQLALQVEPTLSGAFIKSVNELEYLTNPQGALEIPLKVTGTTANPKIIPDVGYVASKVAASKTQDILTGLLQKGTGKTETAPAGPAGTTANAETVSSAPKKEDPYQQLLGSLLQAVSEKQE